MRERHRDVSRPQNFGHGHPAHVRDSGGARVLQVGQHRVDRASYHVIHRRFGAINDWDQSNEPRREGGIDCLRGRGEEVIEPTARQTLSGKHPREQNRLGIRQRFKRTIAADHPKEQRDRRLARVSHRLHDATHGRRRHRRVPVGIDRCERGWIQHRQPQP